MAPSKFLGLYLICAATFLVMDLVWLFLTVPLWYRPALGGLLRPVPSVPVAVVFFLLYIVGLVALAVIPGLREQYAFGALWRGALFGLVAYATYDLTNLATLANWPVSISLIDMTWGLVLNSVVATVGFYGGRMLGI